MSRRSHAQLNIRSDIARRRVTELVNETGKTAAQVVEDALQAYRPPPPVTRPPAPEGLEWRGKFLVMKDEGGRRTTMEETLRRIDEARDDRIRHVMGEDVD